jgi:uncharacterized Zn-finger protein
MAEYLNIYAGRINMNEIIESTTPEVVCDGNGDTNGHPRVYLNMGDKTEIVCPYCSRKFVLKTKGKNAKTSH